jgi:hypothetical protein
MMSLEFGGLSAEMVISVLSDTISVRYSIYALFNNELGQEEYELIDDIHILNHPEKVYGDLVKYSLTQDDKYLEKYFEEMFEYVKGINNSCIAI